MRASFIAVILFSITAQAHSSGSANDAYQSPIPVRSVREVNVTLLNSGPTRGIFTKFEKFHGEQVIARDLREKLAAENQGDVLIERSLYARANANGTYGEIFATAFSLQDHPDATRVEGWAMGIVDLKQRGLFTSGTIWSTIEPLPQIAVVKASRGLQLGTEYSEMVFEQILAHEKTVGDKVKFKNLRVFIKPLYKLKYSVAGVRTGGMLTWQDAGPQVELDKEQSELFLFHAFNCGALLLSNIF